MSPKSLYLVVAYIEVIQLSPDTIPVVGSKSADETIQIPEDVSTAGSRECVLTRRIYPQSAGRAYVDQVRDIVPHKASSGIERLRTHLRTSEEITRNATRVGEP